MSNPDGTMADTEPLRSPNILTKTESLDTSLHTELGTDEYGSACSTPHVLPKANSSSTTPGGGATASGGGGSSGGAVGSRRASEDFNNDIVQNPVTTVKISEMYVKRVNPESCTASTASEDDTQTGTEEVSHDSRFPFADAEKSERESELIERLDGLSRFPEERSSRRESTTDPSLTAAGPLPEPRLSLLRYWPGRSFIQKLSIHILFVIRDHYVSYAVK